MEKEINEREEALRLLRWIREYGGWWKLICTPDEEHMNLTILQTLIARLQEEGFYSIIFVLLTVHRDKPYVQACMRGLLEELVEEEWARSARDLKVCAVSEANQQTPRSDSDFVERILRHLE